MAERVEMTGAARAGGRGTVLRRAATLAFGLATAVGVLAAWAVPAAAPAIVAAVFVGAGAAWALATRRQGALAARLAAAERGRAQLAARQADLLDGMARHRAVVEACAQPIWRKDGAGRLTYANRACRDTFGVAAGGAEPRRLAGDGPAEAASPTDMRLMTVGGPRWFDLDERPVIDAAGRPVETQVVARDVTRRHLSEAEARIRLAETEAAEATRSRLLAAVTHEVRTPISGVMGMTDLLLDTGLRPEQQSYATSIRSSASALLSLIDDLLDHASLESGRLAVAEQPYALEPLVQEVCELLGPRADEKGLSLGSFVARGVPREILGDAARVRQVLLNLVGNALKFTEHGGVIVEAKRAACGLEIAVRDTGRGIAGADRDRVFGEFERTAGSQGIAGNGLGLAISRRVVEAMGGTLTLRSRRGRGSVFTLALPLRPAGGAEAPSPSLAGRRFLVASASAITRRAVAFALRDEGAAVASFSRPRRVGAALAEGAGRDGVLVDLAMLRRLEPELRGSRVVALLSPSERDALPEIRALDASYLIKPTRRASLVGLLAGAPDAADEPVPGMAAAVPALRVLLAEDDEVTALVMRSAIGKLGHAVERVRNGQEAISRSGQTPGFDLLLVDMNMPGLGGAAAAAAIRSREARRSGRRTPIVAMSAGLTEAQAGVATAAGIDMVLAKPVTAERLADCIARLVPARASVPPAAAPAARLSQNRS